MRRNIRRLARAGAALLALLACGGCQFLQNEFATLDRLPPSARAAAATAQPW